VPDTRTIHATTVAIDGRAIVLRGPSGSGKSDLALRLIVDGADLVADDRTELTARDGALIATSPPKIAGLLEVRGVGVLSLPHSDGVPVALLADLDANQTPPRLPTPDWETLNGIAVARIGLAPFEASASAKLRMALRHGVGVTP
jgi:HPr kinase/phosphorylase